MTERRRQNSKDINLYALDWSRQLLLVESHHLLYGLHVFAWLSSTARLSVRVLICPSRLLPQVQVHAFVWRIGASFYPNRVAREPTSRIQNPQARDPTVTSSSQHRALKPQIRLTGFRAWGHRSRLVGSPATQINSKALGSLKKKSTHYKNEVKYQVQLMLNNYQFFPSITVYCLQIQVENLHFHAKSYFCNNQRIITLTSLFHESVVCKFVIASVSIIEMLQQNPVSKAGSIS